RTRRDRRHQDALVLGEVARRDEWSGTCVAAHYGFVTGRGEGAALGGSGFCSFDSSGILIFIRLNFASRSPLMSLRLATMRYENPRLAVPPCNSCTLNPAADWLLT